MSGIAVAGRHADRLVGRHLPRGIWPLLASVLSSYASSTTFSSGAPSIVTGLFIYEIIVANMHSFSAGRARPADVIVIPVVCAPPRTCCSGAQRLCAKRLAALGASRNIIIRAVTWRAARAASSRACS